MILAYKFHFFKFITGLNVPSFLGTKNKFEINCPSTAKTFLIAPLANPVPKVDSPITKVRKLIFYEWQKITNDLWLLDTVKNGYKIEFSVFPTE
jgi:hypothetical protein